MCLESWCLLWGHTETHCLWVTQCRKCAACWVGGCPIAAFLPQAGTRCWSAWPTGPCSTTSTSRALCTASPSPLMAGEGLWAGQGTGVGPSDPEGSSPCRGSCGTAPAAFLWAVACQGEVQELVSKSIPQAGVALREFPSLQTGVTGTQTQEPKDGIRGRCHMACASSQFHPGVSQSPGLGEHLPGRRLRGLCSGTGMSGPRCPQGLPASS